MFLFYNVIFQKAKSTLSFHIYIYIYKISVCLRVCARIRREREKNASWPLSKPAVKLSCAHESPGELVEVQSLILG